MKRLAVVVLVALGGFVAAFVQFGDAARANCMLDPPPDASYAVAFEELSRAEDGHVVLEVTRDGRPVTGAWVCVRVAPAEAPDAYVGAEGREVGRGRYALPLDLTTAGEWSGTVLIGEPGAASEVAAPVSIDVPERRSDPQP